MKKSIIIGILFLINLLTVFGENEFEKIFWNEIANNEFEKAISIIKPNQSKNEIYKLYLSTAYNLLGDYEKSYQFQFEYYNNPNNSIDIVEKVKELSTEMKDPNIDTFLGVLLWENDYSNDSSRLLQKVIESDTKNPYAFNYYSMKFYAGFLSNYDNYLKFALKALELKPDYSEAYNNAAVAYMEKNNKKKAAELLLTCIEKSDNPHPNTYYNLLSSLGESGVAIKYRRGSHTIEGNISLEETGLNDLHTMLKSFPSKYDKLLENMIYSAMYDEANYLLDLCIEDEVLVSFNYFNFGINYLLEKNEEAKKWANKYFESKTESSDFIYNTANDLYRMGEFDLAIKFYKKSLSLVDKSLTFKLMQLNSNMGTCYLEMEDYETGLIYLQKALEFNPFDAISHINIGRTYMLLDNKTKAKEYLNKAIEYSRDPYQIDYAKKLMDEL